MKKVKKVKNMKKNAMSEEDKQPFKVGDKVRLKVIPNRTGIIYAVRSESSGNLYIVEWGKHNVSSALYTDEALEHAKEKG